MLEFVFQQRSSSIGAGEQDLATSGDAAQGLGKGLRSITVRDEIGRR